ncbi:hypothetical protein JCM17845_22730 [Iodidimonas gelatinilytica]|uniref:Uncharacterized protein n=1 Tax=Iodidimonas gelatinilytica TaxID=1236966 RepID=A0A5A7N2Q0_9PROT|nr:hypothetical protein [Iodidimonas gelatinilytica]GER01650.1 hypothetical protein JCM17845_22730 [Iodidimonas gelatinilytica]
MVKDGSRFKIALLKTRVQNKAGGIHIELAGLAFLTVGVLLGTIPDQVAPLLGLQ